VGGAMGLAAGASEATGRRSRRPMIPRRGSKRRWEADHSTF
jgi:hypothetical protein